MFEHFEAEKAKKKAMTAEEKKAAKKAKDDMEAKYTTCLLDGRKEKVGNFRVEPPGLFRGRGDHPKKGALKVSLERWKTLEWLFTSVVQVPGKPRRHHDQHWQKRASSHSQHAWQLEGGHSRQHCYVACKLDRECQWQSQICFLGCW